MLRDGAWRAKKTPGVYFPVYFRWHYGRRQWVAILDRDWHLFQGSSSARFAVRCKNLDHALLLADNQGKHATKNVNLERARKKAAVLGSR